jgi:hypothetical protein
MTTKQIPPVVNSVGMELKNNSALQNSIMGIPGYAKPEIHAKARRIRYKPAV